MVYILNRCVVLYDRINFKKQPIFFDSLPEMNQTQLIDQYTQAATQGIKELNDAPSHDSIVHEVVHLHSDKLFRLVFRQGCPHLNTPNAEGNTPLLEAVAANDEALVIALLSGDIEASINYPNLKGITPLFAAVDSGNPRIVELLLKHGAAASVNMLDKRKMSPLHSAATLKDGSIVALLLEYGAKESLSVKDFRGLTPFQRAVLTGRLSAVKMMLKAEPELSKTINHPDSFGVTNLHRAARSGNPEMVRLLRYYLGNEKIKLNSDASFTDEELGDCLAVHTTNVLEGISIDDVSFPLAIAQNQCSVMIGLKNGKILKIPNGDAVRLRAALLDKKYGLGAAANEGLNILTLYMNPGHGYLRMECEKCDDGKPFNENQGFWGAARKLPQNGQVPKKPEKSGKGQVNPTEDSIHVPDFITKRNLVMGGIASVGIAALQNYPGVLTAGVSLEAGLYLVANDLTTVLDISNKIKGVVGVLTFGSYTGNTKRYVGRDILPAIRRNYMMLHKQIGDSGNEDISEGQSDENNFLKIMFYVNNTQAKAALEAMRKKIDSCRENPVDGCVYYVLDRNCVDFMQDIYQSAGGQGDFARFLTDQQLSHGHVTLSPSNLQAHRAHNYAFVRSRGMEHYLKYGFGETLNKMSHFFTPLTGWNLNYRSLPNPFVKYANSNFFNSRLIKTTDLPSVALMHHGTAEARQPIYQSYIHDDALLGIVLIKTAINAYNFVKDTWGKIFGERVTAEEWTDWQNGQEYSLRISLDRLHSIGSDIDEAFVAIDNEIDEIKEKVLLYNDPMASVLLYSMEDKLSLELMQKARSGISKLWNQYIDLQFEGIELEDELNRLKIDGRLPTKTHLANLEKRIETLFCDCTSLVRS